MPIRPELWPLYPPHWRELSSRVRFERAGGRCQRGRDLRAERAGSEDREDRSAIVGLAYNFGRAGGLVNLLEYTPVRHRSETQIASR
jgi:hypothetical protein